MADARPLIAKIQVEHSGGAKGSRTSTNGESKNEKVNKAIHSSSEENTQETKKGNLFLDKLHKVGKFQLLRFLGINLALHTLVKQSAVYTSVLGSVFQMLGALIDMILAPLLPLILPFLRSFAQNLPKIAEKITSVLIFIGGLFKSVYDIIIRYLPFMQKVFNVLGGALKYWIVGLVVTRLAGLHMVFLAYTGKFLWAMGYYFGKLMVWLAKRGRVGSMFGGKNKQFSQLATIQTKVAYINALSMGAGMRPPGGIGPVWGGPANVAKNVPKTAGRMSMMGGGALAMLGGAGGIIMIAVLVTAVIAYLGFKSMADKGERYKARNASLSMVDSNGNDIPDAGQLRQEHKESFWWAWVDGMSGESNDR